MSMIPREHSDSIPAATLVVFRRAAAGGPPELLMIERSMQMRFAPGMTVFPGGRVDAADHVLAQFLATRGEAPALPLVDAASRIAALRETLEETGLVTGVKHPVSAEEAAAARALLIAEGTLAVVLERFGWSLDLTRLVPFAHWCPDVPRAFDTRFYLTDLGTGAVDLAVDETENSRLHWASAAATLAGADAGEAKIIFPTQRNLERLAQFADFAAAAQHAATHPVAMISPRQEPRDGVLHLVIPEGLGYPVTAESMETVRRGI